MMLYIDFWFFESKKSCNLDTLLGDSTNSLDSCYNELLLWLFSIAIKLGLALLFLVERLGGF